ncbi:hypothetical protein B0H19DRAFT_1267725 [Mycena capillaripes]|nr:hypothetical protein B0H19DRAFT_1267725 [Mycena capillaripes]
MSGPHTNSTRSSPRASARRASTRVDLQPSSRHVTSFTNRTEVPDWIRFVGHSALQHQPIATTLALGAIVAIENWGPEIAFRGGCVDAAEPNAPDHLKATVALLWSLMSYVRSGYWLTTTGSRFLELGENLYSITVTFYEQPPAQVLAKPPRSFEIENVFMTLSITLVQIWSSSSHLIIMLLSLVFPLFTLVVVVMSVAQLWTFADAVTTL